MKKLVAEQSIVNDSIKTTDHGSRLNIMDADITRFSVELNKTNKNVCRLKGRIYNDNG